MYLPPEDFLYERKGPWPQPSPDHPMGEAPEVLHLPNEEIVDWKLHIGLRYTANLLTFWPCALEYAATHHAEPLPSDAEFARMMLTTLYTRFLAPLDGVDKVTFASYLSTGGPDTVFYKIDFTAMGMVQTLVGTYVSPTVTLVRQEGSDWGSRRIVAVALRSLVLSPSDGAAWDLAKAFVLSGAAYHVLFCVHPALHFPFDSVNAITKSSVPMKHPLFKTLFPHTRFTLVLDNAVLEGRTSVVNNHAKQTIYDPLTADADKGLKSLFAAGYVGIPGNSGYPKFEYTLQPSRLPPSEYGDFLGAYFQPVVKFCTTVAQVILQNDPQDRWVVGWARYIRQWIPGFPDESLMHDPNVLGGAMARFIWDVTIGHGTDHQSFSADISVVSKYLRIRVPPPESKIITPVDPAAIYTRNDTFRASLCNKMFFAPTTVTTLATTVYDFDDPVLITAAQTFQADLRATDAGLSRRYMALNELPGSIQY